MSVQAWVVASNAMFRVIKELNLRVEHAKDFDLPCGHKLVQTRPQIYRVGLGSRAEGGWYDCQLEFCVPEVHKRTILLRRSCNIKWETWDYRPEIYERLKARAQEIIRTNKEACDELVRLHDDPDYGSDYKPFEFGQRVMRRRIHDFPTSEAVERSGVKHIDELNAPSHIGMVVKCARIPDDPYRGFNVTIAPDDLIGQPVNHLTFPGHELDSIALDYDTYEITRIYEQWYGKCYTCHFWGGKRDYPTKDGRCEKVESDLYKEVTTTDGHCDKWDAFEDKIIFELLEKWNKDAGAGL